MRTRWGLGDANRHRELTATATVCCSPSVPEMLAAGLTTVVGLLGTDTITRSPEDLLATVNAVNSSPMSAYHYTGGYDSVPECKSVTGSIQKDIALLPNCIGVGEVAMSDHRGSQPGADHVRGRLVGRAEPAVCSRRGLTAPVHPAQFRNLVAQARVGGLLGGNAGLMYVHIGTSPDMLQPLWDVIRNTPLPIAQILPTHMSRSQELIGACTHSSIASLWRRRRLPGASSTLLGVTLCLSV